LAKSWKRWYWI